MLLLKLSFLRPFESQLYDCREQNKKKKNEMKERLTDGMSAA